MSPAFNSDKTRGSDLKVFRLEAAFHLPCQKQMFQNLVCGRFLAIPSRIGNCRCSEVFPVECRESKQEIFDQSVVNGSFDEQSCIAWMEFAGGPSGFLWLSTDVAGWSRRSNTDIIRRGRS
jgi:hypothetical protein